jgi:hypothetical protein
MSETVKICKGCGEQIHPKRVEILPFATTCVKCSDTKAVACHTIISGKNEYSQIEIVDQETAQKLHHLGNRKSFGISNGIKFKFDSRTN